MQKLISWQRVGIKKTIIDENECQGIDNRAVITLCYAADVTGQQDQDLSCHITSAEPWKAITGGHYQRASFLLHVLIIIQNHFRCSLKSCKQEIP